MKFLVTKAIGATGRRINTQKLSPDDKNWLKSDFVITKEEKKIEATIQEISPDLFKHLYTGMGVYLQGLEGDILVSAMLELIE